MAKASITMGTTVATGTFIIYALSAVFVKLNFKISFLLPAATFLTVALIWVFAYPGAVRRAVSESAEEELNTTANAGAQAALSFNKKALLLSIVMLGIYGVATNLIKDGLTTWVPSILKEQYSLDGSFSIILTLALPGVALFGNAFAVAVHKRLPDYVLHTASLFLTSGLILGAVIAGVSLGQFWLTLIGFAAVCFLVSSSNSVITSVFPLFMKGKVNSGFIAGILNGCCYLGSTISSYGLGEIADNYGWITVFWVLLGVCCAVCVGAVAYLLIKKIFIGGKSAKDKQTVN
jgi:OPA family glycerol-3-phosphate transporter-like MFS transporter